MSEETKTPDHISEMDHMRLELAKAHRKIALSNTHRAVAEGELAEARYRLLMHQMFLKYGLTPKDVIDENSGSILYGAAPKEEPTNE